MSTARSEFLSGVKALLPILLGVIPFGLISGVAVIQTNIPAASGFVMSLLIFSGAALIVALQLISTGAPAVVVLFSALAVNLRFMIYSASLAPYFKNLSASWKSLLAYMLSDQAYAASILHISDSPLRDYRHWHFLGSGLTMWIAWQISVGLGMLLGTGLPASWSLEFSIPLTFLALAVPAIKDKSTVMAAFIASVVAILAVNMPFKMGMIVAALFGIVAGMLMDGWKK
jgi:predicted branched-subunit amino acid permease